MPVSSRICPKEQQPESFESPYRTETSFKNFSAFLNRSLTVHSRYPNQFARFSLLDMLKHIDTQQAILKGSSVRQWKNEKPPADIDLQFSCNSAIDKKDLTGKIINFLNTRSNRSIKDHRAIKEKIWFAKVTHQLNGAWTRLIVSVGYPHVNSSTLDLNFTNHRTVAHDAIHASKAIQFNWAQRKAFNIGSWHPSLVDWLQENRLLWFNTDIDEGLGRLSYRLSKSPDACLLQPELASHFCMKATHTNISGIYMRVLLDEYPRSTLSPAERQQLWEPVIQVAETGDQLNLRTDLLAWTKFNTLEQLRAALNHPDTQTIALNRLTKACQIGADFKTTVKKILISHEEYCAPLKPLISKALGVSVVQGELLFNMLDRWDQIQEVPEHELQTVFEDCLKSLRQSNNPTISSRADHMMGWLKGDDLASLKFWIDRIPEHFYNAPPEKLIKPVMQGILHIIKTQGIEALSPVLSNLGKLPIRLENWHTLARALGDSRSNKTFYTSTPSENLILEFMHILSRQSVPIAAMATGKPTSAQHIHEEFHQHLLAYASSLQGQQMPPMLRNIVKVKADGVDIALPGMVLSVSRSQAAIIANVGTTKHWLTKHGRAKLKPEYSGNSNIFYMEWYDGSLFSGKTNSTGNFNFDGVLTHTSRDGVPPELSGLLNTARSVCTSRFPEFGFDPQSWTARGLFNGKQLLKSTAVIDAVLAMKQGVIVDQLLNQSLRIEHEVTDGIPIKCAITVEGENHLTEIKIRYRKTVDSKTPRTELNNAWGVEPMMDKIESIDKIITPPFGKINFTTTLPWDEEKQALQGFGEIKATGLLKFKWSGHMKSGELLPEGKLYQDKQKTPAIVFDEARQSPNIPRSLLPVMADLLGPRLNGNYPFSPVVWHDPDCWPIPGFEGFVDRYAYQNLIFSGYLTSTGRAIGILSETNAPGRELYSAWAGAFYVRSRDLLGYKPVGIDKQDKHLVCVPLSANEVLTPHGIVREYILTKESHQPRGRLDRVYFCGEGLAFRQITQNIELVYDSPNTTRYLIGVNYTLDQKPKHLDFVFNPGDGGNDFMVIRPESFDTQSSYQELYRDAMGTNASWLVVNKEYRMVNVQFPSGLEYSGQIEKQDGFFRPHGKGKLTFGSLSFTAEFERNATIKNLQAMNSASADWLAAKTQFADKQTFQLSEWINLISDGHLDWQNDLQAYLQVRKLGLLKSKSTVFSPT